MIAAQRGNKEALDLVRKYYERGGIALKVCPSMPQIVTKEQYENALRAYHNSVNEMKSEGRDKAAADRSCFY